MTEYGPPGTRLLFENAYTRVWEVALEPGATLGLHAHEYPYVVITIEGSACVLILEDGSEVALEPQVGEVQWKDIPDVHALRNVGTSRYRNRFIEFKVPLPATESDLHAG